MSKVKIGLALGGGGARGLAHIGVIKALIKANIGIDYLVGSSMGGFMAACYSVGLGIEEIEQEARSFNKRKALKMLVDIAMPKKSILKGKKIHRYIENLLNKADFNQTKIPLRIMATNLANGEPVVISKGSLAKAIQASICVPGIFPPVKIDDKYLIDGGVANPTPVDQAILMGADMVIGVDLMIKKAPEIKESPSLVAILLQSYDIIRNKTVNFCEGQAECKVVIMRPDLNDKIFINSFKFYDIGRFIEAGEKSVEEALPAIKRMIKSFE